MTELHIRLTNFFFTLYNNVYGLVHRKLIGTTLEFAVTQ